MLDKASKQTSEEIMNQIHYITICLAALILWKLVVKEKKFFLNIMLFFQILCPSRSGTTAVQSYALYCDHTQNLINLCCFLLDWSPAPTEINSKTVFGFQKSQEFVPGSSTSNAGIVFPLNYC